MPIGVIFAEEMVTNNRIATKCQDAFSRDHILGKGIPEAEVEEEILEMMMEEEMIGEQEDTLGVGLGEKAQ